MIGEYVKRGGWMLREDDGNGGFGEVGVIRDQCVQRV